MTIENEQKSKPIFEDFVIAENGEWQIWFLCDGNPCGKHSFRLEMVVGPTPANTFALGFDVMNQRVIETAGWRRLSIERPDLATWFRDTAFKQFPRCESCNEYWKKMGCS